MRTKLKTKEEARHGDLSFHSLQELPKKLKKIKHNGEYILARGEATGHYHKLQVLDKTKSQDLEIYQDNKGRYVLNIKTPCELTHQEHKTIQFTSGIYIQEIEQDYNPFEETLNRVKD